MLIGVPGLIGARGNISTGLHDGDPVVTWPDSSGNGFDAAYSNTSPIYKTNIVNGKPVVRYNGTTDLLVTPTALTSTITTDVSIFAVVKVTTVQMAELFIAFADDFNNRINVHLPWVDGNVYWDFGNAGGGGGRISAAWGGDTTNFFVWSFVAGSSFQGVYRNGSVVVSQATSSTTFSAASRAISIGATQLGDYAELLFYNATVGSTNRANIEKFLGDKYGISVAGGSAVNPSTVTGLQARYAADTL